MAATPEWWFNGYCGLTSTDEGKTCGVHDRKGSWTGIGGPSECAARCRACSRCRFVTWSPFDRDCSWYSTCDLHDLGHKQISSAWSARVARVAADGANHSHFGEDFLPRGYYSAAVAASAQRRQPPETTRPVGTTFLRLRDRASRRQHLVTAVAAPRGPRQERLACRGIAACTRGLSAIAGELQQSRSPFVVLPQYWDAAKVARAKDETTKAMRLCNVSGEGGDARTFHIDALKTADGLPAAPLARQFARDPFLRAVASHFHGRTFISSLGLASLTQPGANSGGGWHIDTYHRGIKALLYLTDVSSAEDGAFAMLRRYDGIRHNHDPGKRVTRYDADEIARQVRKGAVVEPIVGKAGTVVLFDITSVHRGLPVARGRPPRLVLTNYYENPLPACRPPR